MEGGFRGRRGDEKWKKKKKKRKKKYDNLCI
jgi:hypothetical protein